MKRISALLLLTLFFLSQAGYFFIYSIQQQFIKREMKERVLASVRDEDFEVLELNADIKWLEEDHEFSYHEEMYDVEDIRHSGGKTYLYCLKDKKEKELMKRLAEAVKRGHGGKSKTAKVQFKFQSRINGADDITLEYISSGTSHINLRECEASLLAPYIPIHKPPPRV